MGLCEIWSVSAIIFEGICWQKTIEVRLMAWYGSDLRRQSPFFTYDRCQTCKRVLCFPLNCRMSHFSDYNLPYDISPNTYTPTFRVVSCPCLLLHVSSADSNITWWLDFTTCEKIPFFSGFLIWISYVKVIAFVIKTFRVMGE